MKTYGATILPIMSPFGFAGRFVGMTIIMTMAADKVSGGGRVIASLLFRGKIRWEDFKDSTPWLGWEPVDVHIILQSHPNTT